MRRREHGGSFSQSWDELPAEPASPGYIFTPARKLINKRVREWLSPLPPRYRNEVNSSYLPACGFPAPGGPVEIAPLGGGPVRSAYAAGSEVAQGK